VPASGSEVGNPYCKPPQPVFLTERELGLAKKPVTRGRKRIEGKLLPEKKNSSSEKRAVKGQNIGASGATQ